MRKIYETLFIYTLNISIIIYVMVFFGITNYAPQYLEYIQIFIKIYISIILIVLYNPFTFKEKIFNNFDRRVVFTSGILLLFSTFIFDNIKKYIELKTQYIINDNIILFTKFIN